MRRHLLVGVLFSSVVSVVLGGEEPAMAIKASVEGGVFQVCTAGLDKPKLKIEISGQEMPKAVRVYLRDLWGKAVGEPREVTLLSERPGSAVGQMALPEDIGYYEVVVEAPDKKLQTTTDYAMVPPQWPGQRRDSFFASNTSHIRTGQYDLYARRSAGGG